MTIVLPGDALEILQAEYKQNGNDPKRFNKQAPNCKLVIEFNEVHGWSGRVYNRHLRLILEVISKYMKPVLEEMKNQEELMRDEIYSRKDAYKEFCRIER